MSDNDQVFSGTRKTVCVSGISLHSHTLNDIALEVQGAIHVLHRAAEVSLYRDKMVFRYSACAQGCLLI